jgi:glycosyltransferase involved in cell wall biosynthesis
MESFQGVGRKVSVVLCTYNGERFLEAQLQSIINQTCKDIEILISDDNSTDNTMEIVEKFAKIDARIRVHRNSANLGYNENFARAFQLAAGSFIAVSDQDDIWKEDKIGEMMKLFSDERTNLVHCQSIRFSNKLPEQEEYTARHLLEGNDVRKTLFFNTIAGHNIIFRKTLLEKCWPFPKDVFYDWWLVINAAISGQIKATSRVLTYHREHETNVTLGKKDENKQTKKKAMERMRTLNELIARKVLPEKEQQFAEQLVDHLNDLSNNKFSMRLFRFLFRHAGTLFFFKKKKWPSVSHLKIAYRHSFAK